MTKSTSKKVQCMSCGEHYFSKRKHTCSQVIRVGRSTSKPQPFKGAWMRIAGGK